MKGTLVLPGYFGGANWGGAGFDPETGVLYVPSQLNPTLMRITPAGPERTNFRYRGGGGGQAQFRDLMRIEGLSIFKPPYARVTAIDMNEGEHAWASPLGNGPRNHPLLKGLNVPPLGGGFRPLGVLVTKTLLFVSVSRVANNGLPERGSQQLVVLDRDWPQWADADEERKLIYVFDKKSGKLLHAIKIDGLSAVAPMTYLLDGEQYIVVAVGGGLTAELVALSLPDSRR